jgi:hypothetical protein
MIRDYTDHLVPICADGRWDVRRLSQTVDPCMYGDELVNVQEYYRENPFCGYNDLHNNHYFNTDTKDTLNWKKSDITAIVKLQGGMLSDSLQSLSDNHDPFTGIQSKSFDKSCPS